MASIRNQQVLHEITEAYKDESGRVFNARRYQQEMRPTVVPS